MSEPVAVPVKLDNVDKSTVNVDKVSESKETTQVSTEVEAPYSEYEAKHGKPYSVDYFDLGSYWDHADLYTKEIGTIQTYIDHLVHTGQVNNTLEAVRAKLKSVEKMIHSDPTDRKANRVALMAAHFEFLAKADEIKKNSARYGMM